jgi:hypothetical protein
VSEKMNFAHEDEEIFIYKGIVEHNSNITQDSEVMQIWEYNDGIGICIEEGYELQKHPDMPNQYIVVKKS